jgi:hypothetical protein
MRLAALRGYCRLRQITKTCLNLSVES